MIALNDTDNLITVTVFGEFTLADYKEFEEHVLHAYRFKDPVNVLFDWRDMLSYTVDVAWEDVKFLRQHGSDFNRVALVTEDQWQAWGAWVSNLFIDADVRVFKDYVEAKQWVSAQA